nr:MAG TPA: hypothetical protein [Caudoviricetes sp.]
MSLTPKMFFFSSPSSRCFLRRFSRCRFLSFTVHLLSRQTPPAMRETAVFG